MCHDARVPTKRRSIGALALVLAAICASCTPDKPGDPRRGRQLFPTVGCAQCHRIGGGGHLGPDLAGVGSRYDRRTLERWIRDPETIYQERGRRPLNAGYPAMPAIPLEPRQVRDLAAYLSELREGG